jgi:hypothetical protein
MVHGDELVAFGRPASGAQRRFLLHLVGDLDGLLRSRGRP